MLTVAEDTLLQLAKEHGKRGGDSPFMDRNLSLKLTPFLRADLILKGEGSEAENM